MPENAILLSTLTYRDASPLNIHRHARLAAVAVAVPDQVVTNDDIIRRYDLIATDRAVQYSLGITERRWATPDALPSDLLTVAARRCLAQARFDVDQLDRVLYTKLLGDQMIPATAIKVLRNLGATKGLPAFDIAQACSGMVHLMDMAIRYIDSGDENVLILGGDISSGLSGTDSKKDTRTIFLNGDAAVAMLLTRSDEPHFLASYLYTDNTYFGYSYIPFGTALLNQTRAFGPDMFNMTMPDGKVVHQSVIDSAEIVTAKLLAAAGLSLADIDAFVTCDQTTMTWQAQIQKLSVPPEKSASQFHCYGNTVAAMSALNLHAMIESGRLQRGKIVLFEAHGAGASGGGLIFSY
jgi:3-oxoacyl-[acyl-carrier-protein] synthase III